MPKEKKNPKKESKKRAPKKLSSADSKKITKLTEKGLSAAELLHGLFKFIFDNIF